MTLISETLVPQMAYLCFLSYALMQKTNEWGMAGEKQIVDSFSRNLLKIRPQLPLYSYHFEQFNQLIEKKIHEHALTHLTVPQLKRRLKTFTFKFHDQSYSLSELHLLDAELKKVSPEWVIQGGFYGHEIEAILGIGTRQQFDEYEVITITEECYRTPSTVTSMAAVIADKQIFVRQEALETIYNHKWIQHMDWNTSDASLISSAIKNHVRRLYGASSFGRMSECMALFLEEMKETVLYHELGHAVIQHRLLPQKWATLSESTKLLGETIVMAWLEVLADIAPVNQHLLGPLFNMIQVAQTNPSRAHRLFWMYLSDTWFFDTPDEHMYAYSEILSSIMFHCINENLTVDFKKLEKILLNQAIPTGLKLVQTWMKELENLLKTMFFKLDGKANLSWNQAQIIAKKQAANSSQTPYLIQSQYWSVLMEGALTKASNKKAMESWLKKCEATSTSYLKKLTNQKNEVLEGLYFDAKTKLRLT